MRDASMRTLSAAVLFAMFVMVVAEKIETGLCVQLKVVRGCLMAVCSLELGWASLSDNGSK